MAEVKWIKITTDMFDNRKIKHLRKLPDGNNIVLIWVMLLTMAGRCNAGGMIFLTERIPYTPKMLADELSFEETTVHLALQALEEFNMVIREEGHLVIAGWDEYQNIDGLEKIREQNRLRQAKYKQKQKALSGGNVTDNVTVTEGNATDKEREKDLEKDKEENLSINLSEKKKSIDGLIGSAAVDVTIMDDVKYQIDYDVLCEVYEEDVVDIAVGIIAEMYCAKTEQVFNGVTYTPEVIRELSQRLNYTHMEYVFDSLKDQHAPIYNIRAYMKTAIFNSAFTIGAYYTNKVRADGAVY